MDRGLFFVIGDFFATLGNAASASRAAKANRKTQRDEMAERSTDPTAFDKTGRR
jgi:hypothetical protein